MKASRVYLAERIAAIEAFREDGARQHLAAARHACADADADVASTKQVLLEVEAARAEALAVRQDIARYLTWGELAGEASRLHDEACRHATSMHAEADERAGAWAAAKARADATGDRAERMAREASATVESLQGAERLELWLAGRGRKA